MGQVDIPTHFILTLYVSDEQDGCQSSISQIHLPICKLLQEWLAIDRSHTLISQNFNLSVLLILPCFCCLLFAELELLTSDDLGLTHEPNFIELSCEFLIFEIEECLLGHSNLCIKILLICVEVIKI